jgi:fibronectin-binding autotransporter adhesin
VKNRFNPLAFVVVTISAISAPAQAANQYWNPSPLTGNWVDSVWSASSGGGSLTTWTASNDAIFDQAGTYTVTVNADQTATNLNIKAGDITFSGTNNVSSTNLTIDSGASLTAASDRFLKAGTTNLTVNGTLIQTAAVSASTRRVSIAGGSGSIVFAGGFRTSGNFNFAGDISGTGSIITDAAGTFTLSGNNTYAGDTLIRNGNIVRVGSATALSSNSFLRLGGGTNIVELTGANFSRAVGSTAGTVRFHAGADGAGSSGFAAVNADRTVAINGTVSWGAGLFNPTVFHLGTAASTHKVTLTTDINLNAATRTINTDNGSAAVEAEISGSLSGTGASLLTKTGTGVLLLSNANTHAGGTTIAQSQGAINPLRISNSSALGTGSLTIGGGGANDQARLELTGGITVTNNITGPTVRSTANKSAHILNFSGTNTLTKNITSTTGGERFNLQSDSGELRLTGNLSTRRLLLAGAGNGEIVGTTTVASGYALEKEGNGTWTINSGNLNNTTATVSAGKLLVNGTLTNASAAVTGGTLGGTGTIDGEVTIGALGKLSPTAQASGSKLSLGSTLAFDSGGTSIFNWDLSAEDTDPVNKTEQGNYGQIAVTGAASNTAIFNISLLGGTGKTSSYADAFWDTDKSWNDVFASSGMTDLSTLFTSFSGTGLTATGTATGRGSFGFTGTTLNWTAVPEPTSALAGVLLGFGLLRRRR